MNRLLKIETQLEREKVKFCALYCLVLNATNSISRDRIKKRCLDYEDKIIYYVSNKYDSKLTILSQVLDQVIKSRLKECEQNALAEYSALTDIPAVKSCVVQELVVNNDVVKISTYFDDITKYDLIKDSFYNEYHEKIASFNKLLNDQD